MKNKKLQPLLFCLTTTGLIAGCDVQGPQEDFINTSSTTNASTPSINQTAYIKASNTDAGDQFGVGGVLLGNALALSANGTTLAVGATMEASNAIEPLGNQDNNAVYGAGAVYVFTFNGDI